MEKNKVTLIMDGKEILVGQGSTILEAAQQNGIPIPTLCHHPALSNWGGCRLCLVEVDGSPRLAASCVTPVREGMNVVTSNEKIVDSRRMILEFLFAERNHNCMFCPQSGDCELQKLAYEHQMDHLTVSFSFKPFPTDLTCDYMGIDHNRCVLCGRCVRACHEIAGAYVLNIHNRGPQNLIGLDLNDSRESSSCYGCGVCMQVCPTGALFNRYRAHYSVKGHRKNWERIESLCPQCGLICPTISSVQDNSLIKVEGKLLPDNNRPDRGQLCSRGRFEVFKTRGKRLIRPMVRKKNGSWEEVDLTQALDLVAEQLKDMKEKEGKEALFGFVSSSVSNEQLLLFRDLMTNGWTAGRVDTLDGHYFRTIIKAQGDAGEAFKEASWKQIPESDLIILTGGDPHRSQPFIATLIHSAIMKKKSELAILGRMDTPYPFASWYIPSERDQLSFLLKAFLDGAASALETLPEKSKKAPDPEPLERAVPDGESRKGFHDAVRAFIRAKNPLIIAGEDLTGHKEASPLADAIKLAYLKGRLPDNTIRVIMLKPYGNSSAAWKLGLSSPKDILVSDGLRAGLILLGEEDISNSNLFESLTHTDFLAVISPYFTEKLLDKAHVLIPKPLWMEEDGTFLSLDGSEAAVKRKVLRPPDGIRNSWEILSGLAERSGFLPGYEKWEDLQQAAERTLGKNVPVQH